MLDTIITNTNMIMHKFHIREKGMNLYNDIDKDVAKVLADDYNLMVSCYNGWGFGVNSENMTHIEPSTVNIGGTNYLLTGLQHKGIDVYRLYVSLTEEFGTDGSCIVMKVHDMLDVKTTFDLINGILWIKNNLKNVKEVKSSVDYIEGSNHASVKLELIEYDNSFERFMNLINAVIKKRSLFIIARSATYADSFYLLYKLPDSGVLNRGIEVECDITNNYGSKCDIELNMKLF